MKEFDEEEFEEAEAIRAYDAAKASNDEVIPFEEAIAEIEQSLGNSVAD